MFKGRKKELELLEDLYDSKQFEFLVLYGRSTAHLELKAFDFHQNMENASSYNITLVTVDDLFEFGE